MRYLLSAGQMVYREIQKLYECLKRGDIGEAVPGFCAELEHYMSLQPDIDVRGLDAKLLESNRKDLLFLAKQMKEKATKAIMRRQTSKTAQRIFVIITKFKKYKLFSPNLYFLKFTSFLIKHRDKKY